MGRIFIRSLECGSAPVLMTSFLASTFPTLLYVSPCSYSDLKHSRQHCAGVQRSTSRSGCRISTTAPPNLFTLAPGALSNELVPPDCNPLLTIARYVLLVCLKDSAKRNMFCHSLGHFSVPLRQFSC